MRSKVTANKEDERTDDRFRKYHKCRSDRERRSETMLDDCKTFDGWSRLKWAAH
jgi:hypothetical protein